MTFDEFLKYIKLGENPTGSYDTLFNNSQVQGKPFEGTNVSQMTLDQLYQFSDPKGPYGQYVKRVNPEKRVATPMGYFQIVGDTLRDFAGQLNLPGDTVFSKDIQEQIARAIYEKRGQGQWPGAVGAMNREREANQGPAPLSTLKPGILSEGNQMQPNTQAQSNGGLLQSIFGGGGPRTIEDEQARLRRLQFAQSLNALVHPEMRIDNAAAIKSQQELINTNRTKEVLQQRADAGDELAKTILAALPTVGAAEAMRAYMQGSVSNAANKTAAMTKFYPESGITVNSFQDGTIVVKNAQGDVLTGPAAQQAVNEAAELEREGLRRNEFATATAKQQANLLGDTMNSIKTTDSTIGNLVMAKRALKDAIANNQNISGPITQFLPNISVAASELDYARRALGLDVIGSVTFGALSKGELDLAMDQGLPTGLNEAQLLEYVERREYAMRKMKLELAKAARHLAKQENSIETYLDTFTPVTETPYKNMTDDDLEDEFILIQQGQSKLPPDKRQAIIDEVSIRAGF